MTKSKGSKAMLAQGKYKAGLIKNATTSNNPA